ncbi:MAG: septum formation initiator family protein [Candidatus Omnitrophica bacterium]|nr:septum formation initiator family protein [Candidatus Omnitrophota bacterium]
MLSTFRKAFWLFGISAALLIIFLPGYAKLQVLRDKNTELASKLRKLNIENALLQQEVQRGRDDPVYQERIAREKMGMVRKGEIPIKIIPEKKK